MRDALTSKGITSHVGVPVAEVTSAGLTLDSGAAFTFDAVVWTTGAAAPIWLARTGLTLDDRGFVLVDRTLQSTSHQAVFAAGDIASINGNDLPKSGVHAVRQGGPLAEKPAPRLEKPNAAPLHPATSFSQPDRDRRQACRGVSGRPGHPGAAGSGV